MASILDGLNTAKLSLSAQQYAMSISQRNTANVSNSGYTRQDVFFTDPTVAANWSAFSVPGVEVWATRNRFLDQSISYELPSLGENLVKYTALKEIDAIFQGTSGGGIGSSIAGFFNSFTELGSNPADSTLRWQVISTAQTMAEDFHRLYNEIKRVQNSAETHVARGVDDVNRLTAKIAELNGRLEAAHTSGQKETEYALRDERQQYIEELQGKMGLLYFETESGSVTVTTTRGDALVLGNTSEKLTLGEMADSHFSSIKLNGKDITNDITSGEIGGYLQLRDKLIPEYLNTLDEMAAGIIAAVNETHKAGFGLDGNAGENFFVPFTPVPPNTSAARSITVAITDPAKVAAAGDDGAGTTLGAGDNGNAKKLAELGVKGLYGDGTPTVGEIYASLIYRVGSDQRVAREAGEIQQSVVSQLLGHRNAESGVSLNEEAINLIKFQRAYQASSRFVTVLNSLSAEILNFVGV